MGSSKNTSSTFQLLANLIKLLPTGTTFFFQFLNPLLTNNGNCNTTRKSLTSITLSLCAFFCFFSSFTDSFTGSDGKLHHGLLTIKGIWTFFSNDNNRGGSESKLTLRDFIHAFLSLIVFALLTLLDSNTIACFYPSLVSKQKVLVMALPPILGAIFSFVFMVFPTTRHGIGYSPSSNTDT